jgi:tetrahydromethanopterin S-methyltransferase subunit A
MIMSDSNDVSIGPEPAEQKVRRSLAVVREQLAEAVAARKCHTCGCLHSTVEALAGTEPGQRELAESLAVARDVFAPKKYDCLGCAVCYPAIAANAFADAFPRQAEGLDLCPTDAPEERTGWPPLPGEYKVLRYGAPIAVCALNSADLVVALERAAPPGVSIVGTMHTENLGIERVIRNVLANRNIRFLMLCGEDTQQAIGHLPGQSLASLFRNGVDDRGRIVGAKGKRPVLKNVTADHVGAFLRQVELLDLVGETSPERVTNGIRALAARDAAPFAEAVADNALTPIVAAEPRRLIPDPAGFFVVYPDGGRQRLVLEHYTNAGVLDCVLEGITSAALYSEVITRSLISRLDHAAYLGRELARAENSLLTGEPYVQDRAAGEIAPPPEDESSKPTNGASSCGCTSACGGEQ